MELLKKYEKFLRSDLGMILPDDMVGEIRDILFYQLNDWEASFEILPIIEVQAREFTLLEDFITSGDDMDIYKDVILRFIKDEFRPTFVISKLISELLNVVSNAFDYAPPGHINIIYRELLPIIDALYRKQLYDDIFKLLMMDLGGNPYLKIENRVYLLEGVIDDNISSYEPEELVNYGVMMESIKKKWLDNID